MHAGDWRICQRTWGRFERELLETGSTPRVIA